MPLLKSLKVQSLPVLLLFWWGLFVLVQQTQRFFLFPHAMTLEQPDGAIVRSTMLTGFRADVIVASLAIVLVLAIAGLVRLPGLLPGTNTRPGLGISTTAVSWSACGISIVLLAVLTVDMGYYLYNGQRLDLVFFEYLDDLLALSPPELESGQGGGTSQAFKQTQAELQNERAWGPRLVLFLVLQLVVTVSWVFLFRGRLGPWLDRWYISRLR